MYSWYKFEFLSEGMSCEVHVAIYGVEINSIKLFGNGNHTSAIVSKLELKDFFTERKQLI